VTSKAVQAEISNALEVLNGYYEVNEGNTEVGPAALRLIEAAPDLLDMVKKLHHNHWADMPCEINAECGRLIAKSQVRR
jgi:hypothetical protein